MPKLSRFIRRHTPWWLLQFINRHTHTCWAEMAMWKMFDDVEMRWRPSRSCWDGPGEGYDYCGRWDKREDLKLAN